MNTSEKFWSTISVDRYKQISEQWNIDKKLSYDIHKIIPHLRFTKKLADISCGDARVTRILNTIYNFESVYLTDINEKLLLSTLLSTPLKFTGEVNNITERIPQEVADSDTVMWLGAMHYIINDMDIHDIFRELSHTKLIIRVPCYEENDVYINKYSEEFKDWYEANYRTRANVLKLLGIYFNKVKHERMYPKEIDSKFGSIQYLFVAENI